jgi:hypothetical protein
MVVPSTQHGRTGPWAYHGERKGAWRPASLALPVIPATAGSRAAKGVARKPSAKEHEMGWTIFPHISQDDLIEKLIAPKSYESEGHICRRQTQEYSLVHEQGSEILWTVQRTLQDSKPFETHIACFLIEGTGCKSISESEHPYYYSCPPEYLDMAPPACPEWRSKVRRFHAIHAIEQAEVPA